jgi:hypothetical protein
MAKMKENIDVTETNNRRRSLGNIRYIKHENLHAFNNISVISWQSVLLVEETEVPGVNHGQTVVSSTPRLLLN